MSSIQEYHKIKDSDFDVNLLAQYNLYLHVYLNNINIAVVDTQSNNCLLFEQYDFTSTATDITLLACLKNIWENHSFLNASLWNKVIFIGLNQDFVFIPSKHYDEDTALFYLKANCQTAWEQHAIMHTKHYEMDTVAAFPINKELTQWLRGMYGSSKVQFTHFNSCFLQGLLTSREDKVNQINLLVHSDLVSIAVVHNQHLKFINTFPQSSPADVLYFLLFVMEEANLAPGEHEVKIWGNVSYVSECEASIKPYVRKVHLGEPPSKIKLGDGFEALPAYFGFDLFSAYFLLK